MHVRQETWFGDASDDRDDPTLIWTSSRARVAPRQTARPRSRSIAQPVMWTAVGVVALVDAVILMRLLVATAPVPQSSARAEARAAHAPTELASEHTPAPVPVHLPAQSEVLAVTTSSAPAPA